MEPDTQNTPLLSALWTRSTCPAYTVQVVWWVSEFHLHPFWLVLGIDIDYWLLIKVTREHRFQGDDSNSTESHTWNSKMAAVNVSTQGDHCMCAEFKLRRLLYHFWLHMLFDYTWGEFRGITPIVPKRVVMLLRGVCLKMSLRGNIYHLLYVTAVLLTISFQLIGHKITYIFYPGCVCVCVWVG